ncbi:MAG: prolyl oligopeptidase family serine peptidase [Alphaproteobacteria bacterium]|nr:prolyl oligopeptidase family serine peptidase [Alphaproteobacteria bacterium]
MTLPVHAVRLLAGQQGWLGAPPPPESIVLGGRRMDVVEPEGACVGTVVTVHGMSPAAQRDGRLQRLHGALAALGYRVVSPHFPSIAALRIHAGQIDAIEHAVGAIAASPELCPKGRVGVLAVSFSAGLTLIAAGRRSIAERVSGLCLIGAFGDIHRTMEAVLTRDDLTTYAWKIVLANFLDASIGSCAGVRQALLTAALDEWHQRVVPELPGVIGTLPARDVALVHELLGSRAARLRHFRRIVDAHPLMLDLASVVDQVDGVRAPVTLLHGRHDPTIPSEQSELLHAALQRAGVASRLVVSPLLGHGDAALSLGALRGLPDLLGALQGWLDVTRAAMPAPLPAPSRSAGLRPVRPHHLQGDEAGLGA